MRFLLSYRQETQKSTDLQKRKTEKNTDWYHMVLVTSRPHRALRVEHSFWFLFQAI